MPIRASPARTSACTRSRTVWTATSSRALCTALPDEPERFTLGRPSASAGASGGSAMTTQHTILVVEDETSIASFVAAYLRKAGYGVTHRGDRAGGAGPARERAAGADRPRPQAARHRRRGGLPADPQDLGRADPDAHRARRGHRQDHRPRGRRRRLPDQAVQSARARRPREGDPAPRRRRSARGRAKRAPARRPRASTPASARCTSATRRSGSHRRSSTSSGSCSITAGSSSRATSCSSASGATRSPATRARSTSTSASSGASSATRPRS